MSDVEFTQVTDLEAAYGNNVDVVIVEVRARNTPANAGRVQHRYNLLVGEIERLRAALQRIIDEGPSAQYERIAREALSR